MMGGRSALDLENPVAGASKELDIQMGTRSAKIIRPAGHKPAKTGRIYARKPFTFHQENLVLLETSI